MASNTNTPAHLVQSVSAPTGVQAATTTTPLQRPSTASPRGVTFAANVGSKNKAYFAKNNLAPTIALTGAQANAERLQQQRETQQSAPQTSPNPALQQFSNLNPFLGTSQPMSRPGDAPGYINGSRNTSQIQSQSASARTGDEGQKSPTRYADGPVVEEPETIRCSSRTHNDAANVFASPEPVDRQNDTPQEAPATSSRKRQLSSSPAHGSPTAYTYPPINPLSSSASARNASLPNSGSKVGAKKHKCPHCDTEFTRHHNLKSHLLTHSQEKPFGCEKCDMRFRRLHDLKRHQKLHTGERPHQCEQCGRAFARGDALARHLKGPGGCAGRRESAMGGDDVDGEGDEDSEDQEEPVENDRRKSEPNKRARRGSGRLSVSKSTASYGTTYPPVAPMTGSREALHPGHARNGGSLGGRAQNMTPNQPNTSAPNFTAPHYDQSAYAQGRFMDSPKPLSPGQPDPDRRQPDVNMGRSPSISTRMQQQHMLRGSVGGPGTPNGQSSNQQQTTPMQVDPRYPQTTQSSQRLPLPIISTQGISGSYSGPPSAGPASASHNGSGASTRELYGNSAQQAQNSSYNTQQPIGSDPARLLNIIDNLQTSLRNRELEVAEANRQLRLSQEQCASLQQELHRAYQSNDMMRRQMGGHNG